jgi:hypothetical protein
MKIRACIQSLLGFTCRLNYGYDPANDDVRPLHGVRVQADLAALGVAGARTCRWVTPDADPVDLPVSGSGVQNPRLTLWGLLLFEAGQ